MTTLLVGIVSLLLLVVFLYHYGKRPLRHRRAVADDLSEPFQVLLYRGYDGGLMIIEAPDRKRFLQFRKYIKSRHNVGLECGFPRAPWSVEYYDRVRECLDGRGIDYSIAPTGDRATTEFLLIDLRQDVSKGVEVARLILGEVFGLKPDEVISLRYLNVSPREERVGF
jgi:hypothetical protein